MTSDQAESSACRDIWRLGTWCDEERLKEYALKQNESVDRALSRLETQVSKIEETLNYFISMSEYEQVLKEPGLKELMDMTIPEKKAKYFRRTNQCWSHMKRVRNSALCGTCAADGIKFFLNSKAVISLKTCEDMLENCSNYFLEMLNLGKTLVLYTHRRVESRLKIDPSIQPSEISVPGLISDLAEEVSKHPILENMKSYLKEQPEQEKAAKAQVICGELYNIQRKTFIQMFDPFMHRLASHIRYLVNSFKSMQVEEVNGRVGRERENREDTSNWNGHSRSLHQEEPEVPPFIFSTESDSETTMRDNESILRNDEVIHDGFS